MEGVENKLRLLESKNQEYIAKHKAILADAFYDTAKSSILASISLDNEFSKYFPEASKHGKTDIEPFNPGFVCQYDKKSQEFSVIDTWNKTKGILPDRKVMGFHYVYTGYNTSGSSGDWFCTSHKMKMYGNGGNTANCGCPYRNVYRLLPNQKMSIESDDQYYYTTGQYYYFEVDNYLNLYHPGSKLYIVFNKTAFPSFPFYQAMILSKKRDHNFEIYEETQVNSKYYFRIFRGTIFEESQFKFKFNDYQSVDRRPELLQNMKQLIPENYDEIFQLFDRFRQFKSYDLVSNQIVTESDENEGEDTPQMSLQEQTILSLRAKADESISRAEIAEKTVLDLMEKYNQQSAEVMDLKRRLSQTELNLTKKEAETQLNQFKEAIEKETALRNENGAQQEEIEQLKKEVFRLTKELGESQILQTKCSAIGESLSVKDKELEKTRLSMKKIRDINTNLVKEIQHYKKQIESLSANNSILLDRTSQKNNELEQLKESKRSVEESNTKHSETILELNQRVSHLTEEMQKMGSNSSNSLENALSDRISELEFKIKTLSDEKKDICRKSIKTEQELNALKAKIKGIL